MKVQVTLTEEEILKALASEVFQKYKIDAKWKITSIHRQSSSPDSRYTATLESDQPSK